ncbi:MAG: polysaccharide biosynthesis/export family protein [Gemmatimonas sp.]
MQTYRHWPLAREVSLLYATVVAAAVTACGGPALGTRVIGLPAAVADSSVYDASLAAGDVIAIQFPYRPAYNQDVIIRTDGRINLPVVGSIVAMGKTPEQLQEDVRTAYARQTYDPTSAPPERTYLISVGDKLDISFPGATQLNLSVTVRPDGRITLPQVGVVRAEGSNPEALAEILTRQYTNVLQRPTVHVGVAEASSDRSYINGRLVRTGIRDVEEAVIVVRNYAARQVFVAGEVKSPGFVSYQPRLTALQSVMSAGGPMRTGRVSRVIILRRTGVEAPTATVVDLGKDIDAVRSNDLPLRPFDIVLVPKTPITKVYDFIDQYLFQLVPLTRNMNFSYFYDFRR